MNNFFTKNTHQFLAIPIEKDNHLSFPKKSYSLSQLLPYEADKKIHRDLQVGLKEYQLLIRAFLEAIAAFKEGHLEKFDSLVGENACEIRAVWTAIIASKNSLNSNDLAERITQIEKKIDALLQPKKISSLMHSGENLRNLLHTEELDIALTQEEMYILQSFLLTEAKSIPTEDHILFLHRVESAQPKNLKKFGDVSSTFTYNLIRKLRKLLATLSVQFVRETAFVLQDQSLMKMVSEDFTTQHFGWPCIPMFWTYKTVLKAAQQEGIPLIIHAKFMETDEKIGGYKLIDEDFLYFEYDTCFYLETYPTDLDKPVCVIEGIVYVEKNRPFSKEQWKSTFTQTSITNVILAGAADHRQYPDSTQDFLIDSLNDKEFETFKAFAKKEGFSLENPTNFLIQHVYAAQIKSMPLLASRGKVKASNIQIDHPLDLHVLN